MRRAIPFIAGLLGVGACAVAQNTAPRDAGADPLAVVARADQLAARPLWPGFEPGSTPVAVYDGNRTLLFRHSSPPEGFEALRDHPDILVYEGRHPAVTANSSAAIGGVSTATLMPGAQASSVTSRAGVLIHEKFHVFQRSHHPGWSANEVELFTYPVDRADLLAIRELETEALRRALEGSDADRAGCWARAAVDLRRERFALMPAGAVAYERGTELNEGLATYVERLATGEWNDASLRSGFPPDAVRQKAYETGAAMGRLLSRLDPAWPQDLERNDSTPLDVLLERAAAVPGTVACAFTAAERERMGAEAAAAVEGLHTRRMAARAAFLEQPGWRIVVEAPSAPLFPQGFDPLNVSVVTPSEVLHTRFVKLGNAAGEIEVMGRGAMTEAAGDHPLFNGVRTLTITGLAAEPAIIEADGLATMKSEAIAARFRGATVRRTGQTVIIRLPGS